MVFGREYRLLGSRMSQTFCFSPLGFLLLQLQLQLNLISNGGGDGVLAYDGASYGDGGVFYVFIFINLTISCDFKHIGQSMVNKYVFDGGYGDYLTY